MPHVSPRRLNKKTFQMLMRQFYNALEEADARTKVALMFKEIFTKTEKVMLAKRITLIYLLSKEMPFEKIGEILHLSSATISRYSVGKEREKYRETLRILRRRGKFLDILEKILQAGPPPRGRGRWKKIYRLTEKNIDGK